MPLKPNTGIWQILLSSCRWRLEIRKRSRWFPSEIRQCNPVNYVSTRYCSFSGLFRGPLWAYIRLYSLCFMSQAHPLQLEAFSVAIKRLDADMQRPVLQFVGSCRNQFDEDRLQKLQDKAVELKIDGDLQFYKNVMCRLVQALYKIALFLLKVEELNMSVCSCVCMYMLASARALHSTVLCV